jgi:hypothetical protein
MGPFAKTTARRVIAIRRITRPATVVVIVRSRLCVRRINTLKRMPQRPQIACAKVFRVHRSLKRRSVVIMFKYSCRLCHSSCGGLPELHLDGVST